MPKLTIITRFNVPHEEWNTVDDEWMKNRIKIFDKLCRPSVEQQTDKNFDWFIYISPNTKNKYIRKLKRAINTSLKTAKDGSVMYEKIRKDIKSNYNFGSKVITARLDNDDVVSKDYVESSKGMNFEGAARYSKGFQAKKINRKCDIRKVTSISGPFMLYKERIKKGCLPKTVFFRGHTQWDEYVKNIYSKRMWIQVIHENNEVNEFCEGRPVKSYNAMGKFGVKLKCKNSFKKYINKLSRHFRHRIFDLNRFRKIYHRINHRK